MRKIRDTAGNSGSQHRRRAPLPILSAQAPASDNAPSPAAVPLRLEDLLLALPYEEPDWSEVSKRIGIAGNSGPHLAAALLLLPDAERHRIERLHQIDVIAILCAAMNRTDALGVSDAYAATALLSAFPEIRSKFDEAEKRLGQERLSGLLHGLRIAAASPHRN